MELIGNSVKEKNLTGNENMEEIVSRYVESRVFPGQGKMLLPIDIHLRREFSQRKINAKKTLTSLVSNPHLPYEKKHYDNAVDHAISEYFRSTFGAFYNRLSDELFELKRNEELIIRGEKVKVEIPLFASFPIIYPNEGFDWTYRKTIVLYEKSDWGNYTEKNHEIKVSATIPLMSIKAKKDSLLAQSRYHKICSEAYANSVLGIIFTEQTGHARINRTKHIGLDLDVCWIPSSKDLKLTLEKTTIIDRDPILVGTIWGDNYLISKWDVKGELPYEHYLAEFTETKAGEK